MNKVVVKYLLATAAVVVVGYNSVYFSKLSEVQAKGTATAFDAPAYARTFWTSKLPQALTTATDLPALLAQLQADTPAAFKAHAHSLSIGNVSYFLVKGAGEVTAIGDNDVTLRLTTAPGQPTVRIATEYVFGNAARDALQAASLQQVGNTMDLNNIAAEINQQIRTQVVPPFKASVRAGQRVSFVGAIELNQKHLHTDDIKIIPLQLQVE